MNFRITLHTFVHFVIINYTSAQVFSPQLETSLSGYGNYHPQIEVANDNQAVIMWTDGVNKDIYVSKHDGVDFNKYKW